MCQEQNFKPFSNPSPLSNRTSPKYIDISAYLYFNEKGVDSHKKVLAKCRYSQKYHSKNYYLAKYMSQPLFSRERIFGVIGIVVGTMLLYFGFIEVMHGYTSTAWPTTQGVVQHVSIKVTSDKKGEHYFPEVTYSYRVDGKILVGDNLSFGSSLNSGDAHAIANNYPIRKTVTVYYNQESPELSVLEPGIQGGALIFPIIGLLFFSIGFILFVTQKTQFQL